MRCTVECALFGVNCSRAFLQLNEEFYRSNLEAAADRYEGSPVKVRKECCLSLAATSTAVAINVLA